MSNRALLIIALVAVGACLWVYLVKDQPGTMAVQERDRYLFDLKAEQVNRVELSNPSGMFIFVRKGTADWDMESPISYRADASNVGNFLSDLEFAQRRGVVRREGEADFDEMLAKFGLIEPRVRLRLIQGREVRTLSVGSQTARSGIFYALTEEGRNRAIVLIDSMLERALLEGRDYWRSREVIDFSPAEVQEVVTREGGREFAMKKEDGNWQVTRPLDLAADAARVTQYLTDLRRLRAEDFVAEAGADLSEFGVAPPAASIEIKTGEGTQTIFLGRKVPGNATRIYAQPANLGNVITMPADSVQGLLDLLARVRPRQVFAWPLDQTPKGIEITAGSETFRLSRGEDSEGAWRIRWRDWEGAADANKVTMLLSSLRAMEALEFLETKENPNPNYGLARPGAMVGLEFAESANLPQRQTVRFGVTRRGETFLESSQLPFVVTVAQSYFDTLPKGAWELLPDEVKAIDSKAITGVSWQGGGPPMTVVKDAEGKWAASGNREPFDEMFFLQQTEMLGNLAVKQWLGPPAAKDFARPQLTLVVTEGDQEKRILFGPRRSDGTVPVRMDGEPFAFTIPEDTFKALALRPVTQGPPKS